MNNNFLSRLVMLLGAVVLSCNVAWGETIELGQTNVAEISQYSTEEQTFTQGNVTFGFVNAKNNNANNTPSGWAKSQVIQMKEGGLLYNKTALGVISNIRVYLVANTNTFSVTSGTSEKPTTNKVSRPTTSTGTEEITYTAYSNPTSTPGQSATANYYDFDLSEKGATYFQIACGSNTIYIYKIVITYEAATPSTKRIYLSLFDKWKEADAKTGIYDATNGKWLTTFAVEGTGSEIGYYYEDIPTSCNKITIGRFSPSATQPFGWEGDNFWGQSVDFDITNNNLIKLQGWGTEGEAKGKAYGDLSNLYSIGEATYTNCSLTSGSWPTCAQESGTEFDLTISAAVGYKLNSEVTVSGCTAQWTPALTQDATSGTLHVTITGDNASIKVSAISDKYIVTWMANGVEHDTKTDYSYNNALVMPATNPQPCDRNHFIGWTATQNYSSSSTRPSDLFTEAGDKKVTTDITYYAVYAQLSKNSEETFTYKLAYNGGTTTNMTGNNDAALLGLDEYRWSVVGAKNNGSGLPGLNTSGYIALYGNSAGGNTITVTSLTGVTIPNIKVYVQTGKKDYNDSYVIKVNDVPISATDGSYPINATSFVIGNANSDNTQVRIDSIVIDSLITYTSYSTTCTVPTWTMSFDNQGHGAQVAPKDVAHNTATTAPTAPQAIGWAFGGWYKEATCENVWDFTNDVVTRDITLYAKWTVGWTFLCSVDNYAPHIINSDLTYTVQLEANTTYWFRYTDGVSIKYGLSTDGNIMTKDSHTDWKIHQNNQYDCGIATTAAGEYTFHATEEGELSTTLNITVDYPASVAVTFNLNGHGADIIRYTTPGETLATLPTTPTTTGYVFAGWFIDQECTTPWTSTEAISENKTVYAKWTVARTTLYLDAGGSTLWDQANAKFAVYYFNSKEDNGWSEFMTNYDDCDAIYRTTIPQGYDSLIYVRLNSDATAPTWDKKWTQTNDLELTDSWNKCTITGWGGNGGNSETSTSLYDPNVTVTFHYDGYTTDCDEQISGSKCTTITLPAGKIVSGKTFNGWSAPESETPMAAGSTYTMPANDVTLTAVYTDWTITLNYNGTISEIAVPETGVVLPTEAQGEAVINNIFIGFTKTQDYSATDLPDDFIAAGSVYTPATGGEILYALYRQGDAEYKLIKDIKDLRLGAHVVFASIDEDYAMGKTFIAGQDTLPAIVVTKDGDNETISFGKDVQEWILTTNGSNVGTWTFKRTSTDNKNYLASKEGAAEKVNFTQNITTASSFAISIDASGRAIATSVATHTRNTLSMGENGFFACYRLQDITTPDLAIYQHIGTKYVTTPAPVYRVRSVDMVNGRLDKNDYYAVNDTITLEGYANDGYSTSNRYLVLGETSRDTVSKTRGFRMPDYNVIDTLTNRAKQDTIAFMVPECVQTQATQRVDWNSVIELPEVANVNAWNFVGWVRTAINDTTENHTEIFTSYTVPHVDRDTFYAIYSYDGLPTTGFVLSTVNSETTYYLGEYVSGSDNRYFRAVTDKAQALVLHNNDGKLYYQSGDTSAYLKANTQGSSSVTYNLRTTNEANATVWTIMKNEETNEIAISTTINASTRYLRFNYNNGNNPRYSIYDNRQNPVWEKAPSYTTNPVCAQYAYYFTSDEEEAEPEYIYEMGQDGKVIPYSPANECDAKRFMGWSENKVTALQQEAPTMVNVATQTYDRDITLYAVYAAENGGKIVGDAPTTIDNVTAMGSFKTAQDSGMTSLNTRYYFHNAKYWSNNNSMRMKGKDADSSYITTSLIRDLEKIQVVYSNTKPIVSIRSDGNAWTQIALNKIGDSDIYIAKPEVAGDYYVAFSITKGTGDSYSYSDVQAVTYTHNKEYWYSDYSTNCTTAGTATITYAESTESAHQATSIGEVITLPTPKTAGKHFEGWMINEVNYDGGESYKLSHNVTATATWTDAQLVCTPETLYVVSAKEKTVRSSQTIQISCPDITEGTLTIANDSNSNGKLHAVITNAEANAETGLNATVAIEFTPNSHNVTRNATMTAVIGEKQVTFEVHGRSLPDDFVIAHQGSGDKWYALPADITAFGTYTGYEITVDGDNATAPQSAVYHLGAVTDDNGHIRLTPTDTTALLTSATESAKTKIKVGKIGDDTDNRSLWTLLTTDNSSFTFVNTVANNSLKFNNENKFGMYATGATNDTLFRILKVTTSTTTIPITVTEWRENGFSFIPSVAIPTNNTFRLRVNDVEQESVTCAQSQGSNLYNVQTFEYGSQQIVQLQWYNNSTLVATASVVTPARVTENTTLSSLLIEGIDTKSLDIVASSGTLTVDAKATIHNLDIYPGATVAITNDTLTATTLSFHGGLTSTESNYDYEVPRLYIQKEGCSTAPGYIKKNTHVYYYLNVNADNFYPFTVPFKTSGSNIRYASKPNTEIESIWGSAIKISKYNGEARGKGAATTTKYWKDLSYSDNLIPGVGYIITAKKLKGEQYATLRIMMMVSDIDATTDTVAVGAWGVGPETTTAWYNQGWNYIANPYTAMLAGSVEETHHAIQSGTTVRYATIPSPTVDGYDQVPITDADLKPFYGFFIQAGATGNYNFVKNIHNTAPAYLLAEEKPEQEAYISLEGAAMRDRFGLIVGPGHTNDYEINADLTKELGSANDLRAWLMAGETKMAYLAVDDETARSFIPLNMRTPSEGEYTFSIRESSRVEDLEGLYLYDYENGTVTNIINSDYTFSAPAGAVENRFALSAIRQNKAPTDIGGGTDRPIGAASSSLKADRLKIVRDGHIYIIVNGVTFNAEGKEVTK